MLRDATLADAPALAELFIAARTGMVYLPEIHTDEETRGFIRDVVVARQEVIVFEVSSLFGFAALHDGWLDHLYVAPETQGRGIGTALFDEAKRRHPGGFQFWTFQSNEGARRFYERHGCRLERLTDGNDNEEHLPDALYRWQPA